MRLLFFLISTTLSTLCFGQSRDTTIIRLSDHEVEVGDRFCAELSIENDIYDENYFRYLLTWDRTGLEFTEFNSRSTQLDSGRLIVERKGDRGNEGSLIFELHTAGLDEQFQDGLLAEICFEARKQGRYGIEMKKEFFWDGFQELQELQIPGFIQIGNAQAKNYEYRINNGILLADSIGKFCLMPIHFSNGALPNILEYELHYDTSDIRLFSISGFGRESQFNFNLEDFGYTLSWPNPGIGGYRLDEQINLHHLCFRSVTQESKATEITLKKMVLENPTRDNIVVEIDSAIVLLNEPDQVTDNQRLVVADFEGGLCDSVMIPVQAFGLENVASFEFSIFLDDNLAIENLQTSSILEANGETELNVVRTSVQEINFKWRSNDGGGINLSNGESLLNMSLRPTFTRNYTLEEILIFNSYLRDDDGQDIPVHLEYGQLEISRDNQSLGSSNIYNDPKLVVAQNQSDFIVQIDTSLLNELNSWSFDVFYNNHHLELTEIELFDVFKNGEDAQVISPLDSGEIGRIQWSWTNNDPATSNLPPSYDQEMVDLFKIKGNAIGSPGEKVEFSIENTQVTPLNCEETGGILMNPRDFSYDIVDADDIYFMDIDSVNGDIGDTVTVGIYMDSILNMLTLEMKILYDKAHLQFIDVENENFRLDLEYNNSTIGEDGVFIVSWLDFLLEGLTIPRREKLLDLRFQLIGTPGTCTDLKANRRTEISVINDLNVPVLPVFVSNGQVCINETTSTEEEFKDGFQLFPNPATDQFTLSYPDDLQVEKIYLRDLSGRIIQEWEGRQEQLEVRGLQGVYLVEVLSNQGSVVEKIVVYSDD
ncbi:MAG TPA: T9SS type A sorting domain-containing protein [Saprospiraceae bacterium]|nr:T9SS type A sorting domain-containing protein [Saprospiraceae bacterium]